MLKYVLNLQNCSDNFVFNVLKLFGSELCQFDIVAHISDVAPGPLVNNKRTLYNSSWSL